MSDTHLDPMAEIKFYFAAMCGAILLSVFAVVVLTYASVSNGQIATILALIMGFATMIGTNYRTATELRNSDRVRAQQLENVRVVATKAAGKVEEVRQSLDINTTAQQNIAAEHGQAIADMALDAKATRKSVDGALSVVLEKFAASERRWATEHPSPEADAAADSAEQAYREHKDSERQIARRASAANVLPASPPRLYPPAGPDGP